MILKNNKSIVEKISFVAKISILVAITTTIIVISIAEYFSKTNLLLENSTIISNIVAKQSVASLLFLDKDRANKIIKAFGEFYNINRIILYDKSFDIFAKFERAVNNKEKNFCTDKTNKKIKFFNKLIICKNINFKKNFLGEVEIEYSLIPLYKLILKNLFLIFLAGVFSYIFIIFYTIKLQKAILRPLINLIDAMKRFSHNRNSKLKIDKNSEGEIGLLIKTYNNMVEQIKEYSEGLEKLVSLRTKELQIAKDKAEEANKIKSNFIANISHEIKTPLNAIIGFTEIIKKREKDEQIKEFISNINLSANILLKLINDILDFSKFENQKIKINYQRNNLKDILKDLYNFF